MCVIAAHMCQCWPVATAWSDQVVGQQNHEQKWAAASATATPTNIQNQDPLHTYRTCHKGPTVIVQDDLIIKAESAKSCKSSALHTCPVCDQSPCPGLHAAVKYMTDVAAKMITLVL